MENRRRWLGALAIVVVSIIAVGSAAAFTFGRHGLGFDSGMMSGMHGSWRWSASTQAEPISNEQAVDAAENFIADYGGETLELAEVMAFDNHFYAQAAEADTGRYAYEFLIARYSGRIAFEPGPNMMWNQKYGHIGGGVMSFLRGRWSQEAMRVSEEEAVATAQAYFDRYLPGFQVDDHAAAFYGYYTLHTIRYGETVGMLSVNGETGAIRLHSWHGVHLGEAIDDSH